VDYVGCNFRGTGRLRVLEYIIYYIYIYIDTPSARRPRYIYRLILRETIELGKNP
jgi:hypothetical protein